MYDKVEELDPAKQKALRDEALEKAKTADLIIFIGGLNKNTKQDCEANDREDYHLSFGQDALISDLAKIQKNIIVVTFGGNAYATPWIEQVPSLLHCWYLGSMSGEALGNVLSGKVNPSGKLPVTFAKKLDDYAYFQYGQEAYPGVDKQVYYKESIYVGYRHFNTKKIQPQFAFGHGLSYTTFKYGKPVLSSKEMVSDGRITVTVPVTNTGKVSGKEVVQLYIGDVECSVDRPLKELKGFRKIALSPGETKNVTFTFTNHSLRFFDENTHSWIAESGKFKVYICSSETDVRGVAEFELK